SGVIEERTTLRVGGDRRTLALQSSGRGVERNTRRIDRLRGSSGLRQIQVRRGKSLVVLQDSVLVDDVPELHFGLRRARAQREVRIGEHDVCDEVPVPSRIEPADDLSRRRYITTRQVRLSQVCPQLGTTT